jgi:hypothetical protein
MQKAQEAQKAMTVALRLLVDTRTPSVRQKDGQPEASVLDGQDVIFPECLY